MAGGFGQLRARLQASAARLGAGLRSLAGGRPLDPAAIEELEEVLIAADLGAGPAERIARGAARRLGGDTAGVAGLREAVAGEIAEILRPAAVPLPQRDLRPQVILFVGVNGSGKTTTIGKLAVRYRNEGRRCLIAACDTFRAAAVEQLQTLGARAGVPVVAAAPGADPAGLAFDAHARAVDEQAELLLVDTAGRLQNKKALMDELAKLTRVLRKRDPDAPHDCVLVLDAATGQNALAQAEVFQESAGVTGLVMTKLDGSARGGALVAVVERTGLPVHAIGIGEDADDLRPLDPEAFAGALTGAGKDREAGL